MVVEQSIDRALELADRAVFLDHGTVRFAGPTAELLDRPDLVRAAFLGAAAAERVTRRTRTRSSDTDAASPRLELTGSHGAGSVASSRSTTSR